MGVTYNSLTHRMCDCHTVLPSSVGCVVPADENPRVAQARHLNVASGQGRRGASVWRSERHFPPKLLELSADLDRRFLAFAKQIPDFSADFQGLGNIYHSSVRTAWERFAAHFSSEASVFDRCYSQFERLYMRLLDRMIREAVEPVRAMTGPCGTLIHTPGDPFKSVQTSVLCQRLGALKKQTGFGVVSSVTHFDPTIITKASRVLQMDTYIEVREMAASLLERFDVLCRVLGALRFDQIDPELRTNAELKGAVNEFEAAWAECQHVLHQGPLDFVRNLLAYLQTVSPRFRWLISLALKAEAGEVITEGKVTLEEKIDLAEMGKARTALFETLPILVYLDELFQAIKASRDRSGDAHLARPALFQELFCFQDDRHQTLRQDFAKFDESVQEHRFTKFRAFVLGEISVETGEIDILQAKYFRNIRDTLFKVAAFPEPPSPDDTNSDDERIRFYGLSAAQISELERRDARQRAEALERRDRWLSVTRVAQKVQPQLFQYAPPPATPDSSENSPTQNFRRGSGGALRRASKIEAVASAAETLRKSSLRGDAEGLSSAEIQRWAQPVRPGKAQDLAKLIPLVTSGTPPPHVRSA